MNIKKLGKTAYKNAISEDPHKKTDEPELDRDKDGFIVLEHVSEMPKGKSSTTDLVTDLSELEKRLDMFREEKVRENRQFSAPVMTEQPSAKKIKPDKKQRKKLLKSIFNNTDKYTNFVEEQKGEEPETPVKKDTLETTYGQRYSPMVAMVHDIINEYDSIAADISSDLATRANMKTMYRSSQIANLITVKNSKLSAIKELVGIAKTVTDLEYKKEKDANTKDTDGGMDRAIVALGAKYLRGDLADTIDDFPDAKASKKKVKPSKKNKQSANDDDDDEPKSTKKKKEQRKGYISSERVAKIAGDLEDDDESDDSDLANALGKALMKHKDEIEFTPYEKHINMEGKYSLAILADSDKPSSNWKFIAIDKDGKEIKNFKDKYEDLVPKKSECHMSFDTSKLRVTDKNTSMTYKLYLK